ncbi:DinB family protein [Chelativorans xinjiangense]|uniref:DinB family protein n=1 Tax=Chelativorans xinjiangense TaxID=2681485 RepID=UPI001359A0C3|nr:DinB family protein [Chelativorans xinjiangense]
MKQHFEMMAAYNRWANGLIYEAAADLSEEDYARDVGAFFKSMKGTLNHILAADRIWMKRFTGKGGAPARLDTILHPALPALRQAREAEDERIADWIAGLDEDALQGRFTYMTVVNPRTISQRLAPALTHFFNHQTHHRGQAHMILSVLGKEPPSLDMIYFHRTPEGRGYA